jgi:hypothetical protein
MGSLDDGSGIKPDGDDGLVWFHTMGKHPVFFELESVAICL